MGLLTHLSRQSSSANLQRGWIAAASTYRGVGASRRRQRAPVPPLPIIVVQRLASGPLCAEAGVRPQLIAQHVADIARRPPRRAGPERAIGAIDQTASPRSEMPSRCRRRFGEAGYLSGSSSTTISTPASATLANVDLAASSDDEPPLDHRVAEDVTVSRSTRPRASWPG